MSQRRNEFAPHDRSGSQRAGQQHLVRLAFFFTRDRPRGKTGRHQSGQHILTEEKKIHKIPSRFRAFRNLQPRLIRPREIDNHRQHCDVQKQQHKSSGGPQVDQQLAVQNGIVKSKHKLIRAGRNLGLHS